MNISLRFVSYISLKDGLATKPFQNLKDYPFPLCVVCLCVVYKYHRIYQLRGHKISLALGGIILSLHPLLFTPSIRQSCPKNAPRDCTVRTVPKKPPFEKKPLLRSPRGFLNQDYADNPGYFALMPPSPFQKDCLEKEE
jgi:hypothetical protein